MFAITTASAAPVTINCPTGSRPVCIAEPTSTTVTTASTVPPTPTTLPPSDCNGPVTVVSGTQSKTYRPTIPPRGRIDARGATFIASMSNKYAIQVFGPNGGCWNGGFIQGTFPRTWTWGQSHDVNPTAFRIETPGFLVENLRIDVAGDGIKARAPNWTIRGAHLTWVRDDAFEVTTKQPGAIEDSLVESTYVGISTRGDDPAAPGAVIAIRNTLVGLAPMPGPHDSEDRDPGHGGAFKVDTTSPEFVLEDNVFFASQQTNSEGGIGVPSRLRIKSCARNVWVYTGTESIDLNHFGKDPTTGKSCFTISRNRADWDSAVSAWKARHPEVTP